jgi:hypothetical protein
MWLACYTQEEIAEATGMTQKAIDLETETFSNIGNVSDFTKSRSFEVSEGVPRPHSAPGGDAYQNQSEIRGVGRGGTGICGWRVIRRKR